MSGSEGRAWCMAARGLHPAQCLSLTPHPMPVLPAVRAVKAALDCGQDLNALQLHNPLQQGGRLLG